MTEIADTDYPEPNDAPKDVEAGNAAPAAATASEDSQSKQDDVEASSTDDFPSVRDIVIDFNGSLGFFIGSSGFVSALYYEETGWLKYFRYGSLAWIWGCTAYCLPLFMKLCSKSKTSRCPWDLGDYALFVCCALWFVGCAFGGFLADPDRVENYFGAINYTFVVGSFVLFVEPLWEAFKFVTRGGSCRARSEHSKLCGRGAAQPLKLNVDRFLQLGAATGYSVAGIFGGFPPHPALMLPGVYFWQVGASFDLARSFVMVYERRKGLRAQKEAADAAKPKRATEATAAVVH